MIKVALHNLGCKVNSYEIDSMQQMLKEHGYEIVDFAPGADIYIINTCTVTNIADRKSRQMLHKAKKMNPDAIVVATGCYVQAAKEDLVTDEAIDLVIGNNEKQHLIEILENYKKEEHQIQVICDINHTDEYEELEINQTQEHTRAYIKVQDGCNQFCTYCIIPFVRGRVRSRKKEDVQKEVYRLAEAGYQEIVLTGIHLSSYGTDFEEKESLLSLIESVHTVEKIKRIRLGSLEPGIITDDFVKRVSQLEKVCPHFHLSLQSGCEQTLQRMNRKYTATRYEQGCEILRKYYDKPAITTDVIVGFPQETNQEFDESRTFVEKMNFYETHIFKYSRREGTKAAKMENQVTEEAKNQRSHILLTLGKQQKKKYMEQFIGETVEILFEETVEINGSKYWKGHTREYLNALVLCADENLENKIRVAKIEKLLENEYVFCTLENINK